MGVREDSFTCGSVSAGCVESAVIEAAQSALADGKPRELKFEAITEDSVWDVGLSCGGQIQVFVEPEPMVRSSRQWKLLSERIRADLPSVLITEYEGGPARIWIPGDEDPLAGELEAAYRCRTSKEIEVEGKRVFLNVVASREKLVIVGSVHIAVPLVQFAKVIGFETIVVDPRTAYACLEHYPISPDQVIVDWPESALTRIGLNSETYAAVLTHDPKIDDVALAVLLKSPVAYIGALGSRATQAKRRELLVGLGFTQSDLLRIHGPIGLNIGARSPEEIAISIIAEIVQVRRAQSA